MTTSKHPETLALHAGFRSDPATGAVAVPIYQTTSFDLGDTENAIALFSLQKIGNVYTRIGNPTTEVLEQRMEAIEGGVMAMAVASGQAATTAAITPIPHAGDNMVRNTDLRSEARQVGKEGVSTFLTRWQPYNTKQNT